MNVRLGTIGWLAALLACRELALAAPPPSGKPNGSRPVAAAKPPATATAGKHALLIGCTKYPDLKLHELAGPANDVVLMQQMLGERFGFAATQIAVLTEGRTPKLRPTRENIEREFKRLAQVVAAGDQVVILMSGHGTQQPDANPPDPQDPEPDGMDEVFLPADAQPYDRRSHTIPRGIVDDELGAWVRAIRDRGAFVWIIVDSCHSGTIIRGNSEEVERRVPPEAIIPHEELSAARERAAAQAVENSAAASTGQKSPAEASLAGDLHNIVALYAAQPHQTTVELPLPQGAAQPLPYGLLTFTLGKVLSQARSPLTYREAAQRIQSEYVQSERSSPTPLVEGGDCDREVLGLKTWPGRSRLLLTLKPNWQVNAGALHGMTVGSVLQVLPPAGAVDPNKILGHVRIKSVASTQCQVEPCAHGPAPLEKSLPDRARCEVAYLDCSLHKLRVAVDIADAAAADRAKAAIAELAARDSLVQAASDARTADWILRGIEGKEYLEPASGLDASQPGATPRFGPADPELGAWLEDHLRRIARGQNLLSLARPNPADGGAGNLDLVVELVRLRDRNDRDGQPVAWREQGIVFRPGEILACRLKNVGHVPIDATLLFVDAGFGIKAVFPRPGTATDNRIYAGESLLAFRGTVNGKTLGLEHLVMIAVPGEGPPVDFSALEQPTLAQARGAGSDHRGLDSPLGNLMRSALYGGTSRGLDAEDFDRQSLALISWRVIDAP